MRSPKQALKDDAIFCARALVIAAFGGLLIAVVLMPALVLLRIMHG